MENKRYKPYFDKLFWWSVFPTAAIMIAMTVISAFAPISLLVTIPIDVLVAYVLISPFFGYVELRENSVYIKFGLLFKKEIPYNKIRKLQKDRKFYSESILALKNSLDHVNIRYNNHDVITVSVIDMDSFIDELNCRRASL